MMLLIVGVQGAFVAVDILLVDGQLVPRGLLIVKVVVWTSLTIAVGVLLLLLITEIYKHRKRTEARAQNARS